VVWLLPLRRLAAQCPRARVRGLNARLPVQPGNSDLCFRWDGPIEEAVEHLQRLGVPIEAGPHSAEFPCGRITSVYFRDPDGSLLEFLSYD
jgi:catechol 2,3-dioxygenase-like lactoylglutathione lyase family enzyme